MTNVHGLAGCRRYARSRASGTITAVYNAEEQGLDPAGGPWVAVCHDHATLCNQGTLADALDLAVFPEFCEACQPVLERSMQHVTVIDQRAVDRWLAAWQETE